MPQPFSKIATRLDDLYARSPQFDSLREIGFNRNHISTISHSPISVTAFVNAAEVLARHVDTIKSLQNSTEFNASNIAALLAKSGCHVDLVIKQLEQQQNALLELNKAGFSSMHLTSILRGAGAGMTSAIRDLNENKELLLDLTSLGFSLSNLSSMVSSSRYNLGEVIRSLVKQKPALSNLIDFGFTPGNISCMLSNMGPSAGKAIAELDQKKHTLTYLVRCGFSFNHIARMLNSSCPNVGDFIDALGRNKSTVTALVAIGIPYVKLANKLRVPSHKIDKAIDSLVQKNAGKLHELKKKGFVFEMRVAEPEHTEPEHTEPEPLKLDSLSGDQSNGILEDLVLNGELDPDNFLRDLGSNLDNDMRATNTPEQMQFYPFVQNHFFNRMPTGYPFIQATAMETPFPVVPDKYVSNVDVERELRNQNHQNTFLKRPAPHMWNESYPSKRSR